MSETSLITKLNFEISEMIPHEEKGEKTINQRAGSLRKAALWVAITLGLSFVAVYQLIGSDNVGNYEQGTTLHESPGLLGIVSSLFSLSADTRDKRQDDSDDNTEYWNTYDDKEDYDNFWDDFFDDLDKDYKQYDSTTSTTAYLSSTTVWEESTPTTTKSSTALSKSSTTIGFTTTEGTSETAFETKSNTQETPMEESTTGGWWLIGDNSASTTGEVNLQQSTEIPNPEESTQTPNLEESIQTPNLEEESIPTPNSEESIQTPNSEESIQTLNLQESTETLFPNEGGPCYPNSYKIRGTCELNKEQLNSFGADISLEEVTDLIFDPETLNSLTSECTNGTWCLGRSKDRSMFEDIDHTFLELCPLISCLQEILDVCMNEESRITLSTLTLLCDTTQNNSTVPVSCLRSIMKMSHVTLANARRVQDGDSQKICQNGDMPKCQGSCRTLAQQLYCMCTNCLHRYDLFNGYDSWQWYFGLENSTDKCDLNSSDCSMFDEYSGPSFQGWWFRVKSMDTTAILFITTGCVVTLAAFIIVTVVCVKKVPKYSRSRVEYKEVENDEKEDDDEEEDLLAEFNPA